MVNSIQELINKALIRKERVRSGKYSPSSLGKCYRAQYWNRKNEPPLNPPDERTLRVFKAGNLFHDLVQEAILTEHPGAEKEVLIELDDFKGYADLVLTDEVIDIKSQHSRAFHYRRNQAWKDLEPSLHCNILQVVFYAVALKKPRARLVFVSKDDLCIQEFPFEVEKYLHDLVKEMKTLKDYWAKGELPPAEPRAYPNGDGKPAECGYCSWKDLCQKSVGTATKTQG